MIILGIFLSIASIVIFLYYSILVGLIVSGVGLILLIVGLALPSKIASTSNTTEQKKEQVKEQILVDVVYLKIGSIIRGIIIEQIPNESIKIQTFDKNVFVYKMDEILKFTKEPKN